MTAIIYNSVLASGQTKEYTSLAILLLCLSLS